MNNSNNDEFFEKGREARRLNLSVKNNPYFKENETNQKSLDWFRGWYFEDEVIPANYVINPIYVCFLITNNQLS